MVLPATDMDMENENITFSGTKEGLGSLMKREREMEENLDIRNRRGKIGVGIRKVKTKKENDEIDNGLECLNLFSYFHG